MATKFERIMQLIDTLNGDNPDKQHSENNPIQQNTQYTEPNKQYHSDNPNDQSKLYIPKKKEQSG